MEAEIWTFICEHATFDDDALGNGTVNDHTTNAEQDLTPTKDSISI